MSKDNNNQNNDNKDRLLDCLGDVDERYIEEAAPDRLSVKQTTRKGILKYNKWLGMAAGILLVAGCAFTVHILLPDKAQYAEDKRENEELEISDKSESNLSSEAIENDTEGDNITAESANSTSGTGLTPTGGDCETHNNPTEEGQTTTGETGLVPKWNERGISEKYTELEYNSNTYSTCTQEIATELVGGKISEVTMIGYDIYEDKYHYINAAVYELKDISADYALAIQFDGTEKYYIYINVWYSPDTLGEFIDALKLEENIFFSDIWYGYFDEDNNYRQEIYSIPDDKIIWEKLILDNRTLENVYEQNKMYVARMSIGVNMPLLGTSNSIEITEDGYLVTNIFATGKAFYIGEEKAKAFMDYVKANFYKVDLYEEPTVEEMISNEMAWDEENVTEMTSAGYNIDE